MFLLVPAYPGCPRRSPVSHKMVLCMCVCACECPVSDMSAGQLHETLKQRVLQLSDDDQIEILSNIEVPVTIFIFHSFNLLLLL